nr:MAG TPA: hypothetical protein [Caudoviricetes sp.]
MSATPADFTFTDHLITGKVTCLEFARRMGEMALPGSNRISFLPNQRPPFPPVYIPVSRRTGPIWYRIPPATPLS